jgi:hypothetical protein
MKMEAYSSDTSIDMQRTTRLYILQYRTVHNHRCQNLKSYNKFIIHVIAKALPQELNYRLEM